MKHIERTTKLLFIVIHGHKTGTELLPTDYLVDNKGAVQCFNPDMSKYYTWGTFNEHLKTNYRIHQHSPQMDNSINVTLEWDENGFTEETLESARQLIRELSKQYNIPLDAYIASRYEIDKTVTIDLPGWHDNKLNGKYNTSLKWLNFWNSCIII